jgi:hypothetical protein
MKRHDLPHLARLAVQIARTPFRDYASTFAPKR